MKRARLVALLFSVLAVIGLALGLTVSAQATPARPAVTATQMVLFDCPGQHALVRPKTFIVTCADGYDQLIKLSWTSWTPGMASATGTQLLNDCIPNCVAGHFHTYPALVILWGNVAVKGHPGEHSYTHLTEILTGPRPRYYDYVTHKWVTAPVTSTIPLLTQPTTLSRA